MLRSDGSPPLGGADSASADGSLPDGEMRESISCGAMAGGAMSVGGANIGDGMLPSLTPGHLGHQSGGPPPPPPVQLHHAQHHGQVPLQTPLQTPLHTQQPLTAQLPPGPQHAQQFPLGMPTSLHGLADNSSSWNVPEMGTGHLGGALAGAVGGVNPYATPSPMTPYGMTPSGIGQYPWYSQNMGHQHQPSLLT